MSYVLWMKSLGWIDGLKTHEFLCERSKERLISDPFNILYPHNDSLRILYPGFSSPLFPLTTPSAFSTR